MSEYKHVVLTNFGATVVIGDDGEPLTVTSKHAAEMDVPLDQLVDFLADAQTRWQSVNVSDECPEACTAQLAGTATETSGE